MGGDMTWRSEIALLLRAMLPLAIWFACFSVLYGVATLACGPKMLGGTAGYLSVMLVAAVIIGLVFTARRKIASHAFLTLVLRSLSGIAIIAALWLLMPLIVLGACS